MTTAIDTTRAAAEYIAAWDSYEPIEATAHGLADEDLYRLIDAYGEDAADEIGDEIVRLCRARVAMEILGDGYYSVRDDSLIVEVPDGGPDHELSATEALDDAHGDVSDLLISIGATIEWTGEGNTDADGHTTSDICISF